MKGGRCAALPDSDFHPFLHPPAHPRDLRTRRVQVAGSEVELTPKEFDVLAILAAEAGTAVSRQRLMDEVWGDAYLAVSRSLDVHIAQLRAKLDRPELLVTIRGFGYRLGDDA